jgi:outer membrane protein assembly factor BamB
LFVFACCVLAAGICAADDMVAVRDRLLAKLESKPAPATMVLRFDEGADRDTMNLTLRRAGDGWAAGYVEVPGWQQSTMNEWRGYFLGNEVGGCWRPNMRFAADTASLAFGGGQLAGKLAVAYRLDQLMVQREPPGQHIQWWDRFIPGGYTVPRRQEYEVDARVCADACMLELVLEDGLYFDAKWVPNQKSPPTGNTVTRRPITIRLQAPSTRFTPVKVQTPTWNTGYHEADATGLKFGGGKLTGRLVVFIHQDGWSPWGGGKHVQHDPLPITFEVDAQLRNNALGGRYTAGIGGPLRGQHYNPRGDNPHAESIVIPDVKFDGAVRGCGGKLVAGRYRSQGDMGERVGAVDGMLLDDALPVRQQIAADKDTFHQVRALHLALQHYPLPFDEAWRQTDMPAPVADYAPPLPADTSLPAAKPETVGDSPSLGATALPAEDQTNVLPAESAGWRFMPRWSVLGPFGQRLGLENNDGRAPDIAVVPDAGYVQPVDRLGAIRADAPVVKWEPVVCESPRLGVPWEASHMWVRYAGRLWFGAATLRSAQARTVWFAIEANDFAKLWVNDELVWTDAERSWRYRPFGRVFVPVKLRAGDNRFLARVHADRRLSWLRLALTTREPDAPPMPDKAPAYRNPNVFPDAQPPLAWDIAQGINVAWRNAGLGGDTRPVAAGDALVVASPGKLTCLDAATGKERWSADLAGVVSAPVTDGRFIWCAASNTVCLDLAGKQLWSLPVGGGKVSLAGGRLVVEGPIGRDKTAVTVLDAAAGKELKRWEAAGAFGGKSLLPDIGDAAVLITDAGGCFDVATGAELPAPDIEMQLTKKVGDRNVVATNLMDGPYVVSRSADMLFFTSQARHLAVRLWAKDGRLCYAHAWESNYGNSGFGNVSAPALATDKYLFTTHSVLAHTPHSPDPRAEVNVQDVKTGRVLRRLKPAMDDLYAYGALNLKTPTVAGEYLFLLGGRADNSRNQIAVITADEQIHLVASNDVDPGTRLTPVFAGNRMFLRSPRALTCVAVTTAEGKRYQDLALARTVLRVVGPQPQSARPRVIAGLDKVSAMGEVPVGKLIPERTTEFWLGAGPLTAAEVAALKLPDTSGVKFAPLDRNHAYNEPPMYLRTSELQGTGDITPRFKTDLSTADHAGPEGSGLFYTVLDNTRDRIVVPELRAKGVTQWLGGQELKPDEPLYLRAGLYPYLVKVDPDYFSVKPKGELPGLMLAKALAAGAVKEIGWPKTWQVIGPLPADAPPLTEEQLREIPRTLTVGETELTPYAVPAVTTTNVINGHAVTGEGSVQLIALSETAPGRKPDFANAPKKLSSTAPLSAYLFAAVDCPADGYLYINAGADWHMRWFVDGEALHDGLKEGKTGQVDAHRFTAQVRKGRHVVAALVMPGSSGWQVTSIGAFSEKGPDAMPEFRVAPPPVPVPDLRLNPSFREIPHPPTLEAMWRERATRNRARLEAAARELAGTEEAERAQRVLSQLR